LGGQEQSLLQKPSLLSDRLLKAAARGSPPVWITAAGISAACCPLACHCAGVRHGGSFAFTTAPPQLMWLSAVVHLV
jgi:hypothetical protein